MRDNTGEILEHQPRPVFGMLHFEQLQVVSEVSSDVNDQRTTGVAVKDVP